MSRIFESDLIERRLGYGVGHNRARLSLTDRFNRRRLLATYYAFRAASLVLLPSVTTESGLIMFSVLFGLDYIATVPPTVALTAERFGRASLATVAPDLIMRR